MNPAQPLAFLIVQKLVNDLLLEFAQHFAFERHVRRLEALEERGPLDPIWADCCDSENPPLPAPELRLPVAS